MNEGSTEKRWIDHPQFWALFMRMIANVAIVGDAKGGAELVRSLSEATPLFDTELFTKNIEAAYSEMYKRHQSGLAPDYIAITG
jgi:hypothetical protein